MITLIVIPVFAFYYDTPLSDLQYEALWTVVKIYLAAAFLCFFVSTLANNYSQVDKLWSLMPIIYCWVITHAGEYEPRLVMMSILVTIWGLRLSYNFTRRGGYSLKFWEGDEDYRWAVLRAKPEFSHPVVWILFNLFFISLYQMGLILLFSLPILKCIDGAALCWIDYLLAIMILGLIIIETIADQQQWSFHKAKREKLAAEQQGVKGFIDTGLWSLVRHPNYAAEQAIWVVFYFFSVAATGQLINWTIVGFLLLIILFKGSSDFSEEISASKYPEYKTYQENVPRFIPFTKF
jgi:steroid 5-alpha reductase family enzyme